MKKYSLLMALLIISATLYGQINLDQGLIAHYKFSGNSLDSSGNNNHGTVHNATLTTDRFGNPNSAYYFNGTNSYIQVPHSLSLQPSNYELTICAWVKIKDFTGTPNKSAVIFEKGNNNINSDWGLTYKDVDPNPNVEKLRYTGDIGQIYLSSNTIPDTGNWHFIAVSFDLNGSTPLYIDCERESFMSWNGTSFLPNSSDMYIGKSPYANDRYFNGMIDDIRIYNRALSQCEITRIYSDTKTTISSTNLNVTDKDTFTLKINTPCNNQLRYLWQSDTGTGFFDLLTTNSYEDSLNSIAYSSMNGYKYRVITLGIVDKNSTDCYLDTTETAILTVRSTGIRETFVVDNTFIVYPNPANDILFIESKSQAEKIEVINLQGQIVKKMATHLKNTSVNVGDLIPGVYHIRADGQSVSSFVKR